MYVVAPSPQCTVLSPPALFHETLAHMTPATALMTFYTQTWEEYHTHTLTLGIVSGPVEGILTICAVYAITAVKGGGSFWQQSLLQTIGVSKHAFIPDAVYD